VRSFIFVLVLSRALIQISVMAGWCGDSNFIRMQTSSRLGHSNLAFWVLLDMIVFQHILMCCRSLWVLSNCSRVSAHYSCTNVHSSLKFVHLEVRSMRVWYKFLHIEVRFTRVQYKFVLHSPLLLCTFSIFEPYNPNFPQLVGVGRFSVLILSTAWMQILVMAPRCWRFKLY
jgi:hypothetical protein